MVTRTMIIMKTALKRRKDSCGRSVMDWCVCGMQKGMVFLVIGKVQSGWMMDKLHS